MFKLRGTASTGESFYVDGSEHGKPFVTRADAMAYGMEYARGVSGTDSVHADYAEGWIRAVGADYSETIRLEEYGSATPSPALPKRAERIARADENLRSLIAGARDRGLVR